MISVPIASVNSTSKHLPSVILCPILLRICSGSISFSYFTGTRIVPAHLGLAGLASLGWNERGSKPPASFELILAAGGGRTGGVMGRPRGFRVKGRLFHLEMSPMSSSFSAFLGAVREPMSASRSSSFNPAPPGSPIPRHARRRSQSTPGWKIHRRTPAHSRPGWAPASTGLRRRW